MLRSLVVIVTAMAVVGCSSKQVLVNYTATDEGVNDWYVIPQDAPSTVTLKELTVPKATVEIEQWEARSASDPLYIERLKDSIGNETLRLNRTTGASWELVSAALDVAGVEVVDRNRDQYRFDLIKEHRGLLTLFSREQEALSLVLVPDNDKTLLVLEGKDDVTPDSQYASEIVDTLYQYFQTHH